MAMPPPPRTPVGEDETAQASPLGELRSRAARLRDDNDNVGAARAYVELGLYHERVLQDRAAARAAYVCAQGLVRGFEPALTRVRRLLEGRTELATAIELLDDELTTAPSDGVRADLLAERARAGEALGRMAEACACHAAALRCVPRLAASLRGLEVVLRRMLAASPSPDLAAELAAHLERIADAVAPRSDRLDGDRSLAAWVQVERADVLDRHLGQPQAARAALERAVALEPAPGPVRNALARALGVDAFDIYLTPGWQGAARIYPGDPPTIVAATSFAELSEPEQGYALGRLLVRAALGVTWLDELSVDAADGLLMASVRAVIPSFAAGDLLPSREAMVQSFLPAVQRAIGRRQKKLLEEIALTLTSSYDLRAIAIGVRRTEYRVAYLLGGDLLAALESLRRYDRELARSVEEPRVLLQHPVTNELLRYGLMADSVVERRRLGVLWA